MANSRHNTLPYLVYKTAWGQSLLLRNHS